jgi:hypothetical protein
MHHVSVVFCVAAFWAAAVAQSGAREDRSAGKQDTEERTFPMTAIREKCIEFTSLKVGPDASDARECRVSEFGEFGTVEDLIYEYAIYCLIPNHSPGDYTCDGGSFAARYHRGRGLAIFTRSAAEPNARLLFERVHPEVGIMVYPERPQIVRNSAGTLLYIPIAFDGTGVFNASEYYLYGADGWEKVDSASWLDDLLKRIPAGLEIWKGVWPDPQTLEAVAGLYRRGDSNCCPTGGTARIRLSIRSRRMVIDSLEVERVN